jgi:thymidylate synthase (FAD)
MSEVNLVWTTPNGENLIAYMARVSNPSNQDNPDTANKLLKYLVRNKHWSPFEMVNVCMEITTTRDIARQILRHRSFSFQEFSQRYAEASDFELNEVRRQDHVNRQNSIDVNPAISDEDRQLAYWWEGVQSKVLNDVGFLYKSALDKGIAKEVARKLLPEGMTVSKMYMNGTLRSWIHYVELRTDAATQKEHRQVALQCKDVLVESYPFLEELWQRG